MELKVGSVHIKIAKVENKLILNGIESYLLSKKLSKKLKYQVNPQWNWKWRDKTGGEVMVAEKKLILNGIERSSWCLDTTRHLWNLC